MSYDKLAVRYRRWRNEVADAPAPAAEHYVSQTMNAGDLFSVDEEQFSPEMGTFVDSPGRR